MLTSLGAHGVDVEGVDVLDGLHVEIGFHAELVERADEDLVFDFAAELFAQGFEGGRVEDAEGRRFWLFRSGLYAQDTARPPRWFLHGIFA